MRPKTCRERRESFDISQQLLSDTSTVPKNYICEFERGIRILTPEKLELLEAALQKLVAERVTRMKKLIKQEGTNG